MAGSALQYFDGAYFDTAATMLGLRPYTAQDFVTKAYRLLNVIDSISTPEPEQLVTGFETLNEMIDDWRIQSAIILTIQPNRHELFANKQEYTIGPGGDFDQTRPAEITRWSVIIDRNANPIIRIPHKRALTLAEWQDIPIQAITGSYPARLYYDRNYDPRGLGKIWTYPMTTQSCVDLELWTPEPLAYFANLTRPYAFAPGYTRAIRYSLALELATDYPGVVTDEVKMMAARSVATVKRANFRPRYAEFDRGMTGVRGGRRYDPYSDY